MDKLWAGRASKPLDALADDFNSSIAVDSRMFREDIRGSIAHVRMLGRCGILSADEAKQIADGLISILTDLESGVLTIDPAFEDIHSFVEAELTARIGENGKKLHTGRSRNDQVAVDTRLYCRGRLDTLRGLLFDLVRVIADKAEPHAETILPGYTHLQRAQPISFAQYLLAYAVMFLRDAGRLADCRKRLNLCPLGAAALAGTGFPIDRQYSAQLLGFDGVCPNSIDAVSDRDYQLELVFDIAAIAMHLSRFCEEIILYSSFEFRFLELDDAYCTGSSIMPQKKNPDIAELIRGKCGRVYGDLTALLTMMKGLPLAYNKDLQEDKTALFDALDTAEICLSVFAPLLSTAKVRADNMAAAAEGGYINATDLADWLTGKGLPFRTAYKLVGQIVAYAAEKGISLSEIPPEDYRRFDNAFDEGLYPYIDMAACMRRRGSEGGTAPEQVRAQLAEIRRQLANETAN